MSKEDKEHIVILEKYLKEKSTEFSINDAASVTGLPVLETEYAVKDLMQTYDCKLKVTENGDLIYDFGEEPQRRHARKFKDKLADAGQAIWRWFSIFYKFMISITLIVYFVVFVLLVVALVVAALSGGKDNNSSKGMGQLFGLIARVFWSIFEWRTIMGYNSYYYRRDPYGYNYKHYKENRSILEETKKEKGKKSDDEKKQFVASIYDFVFGPPRVELDPLGNAQEVASFLREHNGVISIPEVQALAGWTRAEAENFMTECLANFDGKAEISPNGSLYGEYSELIRSTDRTGEAPIIWYWDEYEPEYELTGNKTAQNAGIVAMNLFNIVLSGVVLFGGLAAELDLGLLGEIFLGWFPLAYSVLFFLIPLVRWFFIRPLQRKQHLANVRKRLMRVIFQRHEAEISQEELINVANSWKKKEEETLKPELVEEVMLDLVYDLGGESYVNEEAKIMYKFVDLDRELDDIEAIRKERRSNFDDTGDVIFEA